MEVTHSSGEENAKAPFKPERRSVHLMVDPEAFRLAKIECAKIDLDLSHATEQLWKAWSEGKIKVRKEGI